MAMQSMIRAMDLLKIQYEHPESPVKHKDDHKTFFKMLFFVKLFVSSVSKRIETFNIKVGICASYENW